jgi:hypothetical protein
VRLARQRVAAGADLVVRTDEAVDRLLAAGHLRLAGAHARRPNRTADRFVPGSTLSQRGACGVGSFASAATRRNDANAFGVFGSTRSPPTTSAIIIAKFATSAHSYASARA